MTQRAPSPNGTQYNGVRHNHVGNCVLIARIVCHFSPLCVQSTAVRKAVRDTGDHTCNGVVYCSVDDVSKFSKQLSVVLGFQAGAFDLFEAARRQGMGETKDAEPSRTDEPDASWEPLESALSSTAMAFRYANWGIKGVIKSDCPVLL